MNTNPQFPHNEGQQQYQAYSPNLQSPQSPTLTVQPPEATYTRNGSRDEPRGRDFNFGFQQQQQQQQRSYNIMPSTNQSLPQYTTSPVRPPIRSQLDSRTNSEVYADSFSTTIQYDSRNGSTANLINSNASRSSSQNPQWRDSSRAGSQVNLLKYHGDLRDFRSPSPGKSGRVLGLELSEKSSTTIFSRNWQKDGSIIKLSDRDDIDHMPLWKRYLFNTTPILVLLSLATYWTYFVYRLICIMAAQNQAKKWYPMAWVFVGIEISVAIPTFLHLFMTLFIINPRKRAKLRLTGEDVPDVDVFITCCREETDLVLDTTRAACDLDYPMDKFRVVVLDDGRDNDLADECENLRQNHYPNLYYMAREKIPGKPHHFKAGNLNYGFDEVAKLPGGPAPFAAALDADMIPERHWLRAIMPHMLIDERMALACPPQLFYNVPKEDLLCQSLDFFVHVLEGIKDALGVAWCTGSGYVLRREALEEIGWFPLGSLAEDVATSTLMLGKGWKTAFIHEPLQFGTVPDSFGSHLKQRTRWAIGTVDTALKLKFCLYGDAIRRMTFFQRLSGFIYAVLSVFNIFMALSLFAMPIVLISGKQLVAYATDDQLKWLVRLCFIALVTNRITEIVMFLPAGYSVGQNGARSQLWMSPYIAICLIRSFLLPTWLGGQVQSFQPSGSLRSDLNERDPILRAGLWTRMRVIIFNYMAWYHVVYVYFCLTAATLTTSKCVFDNYGLNNRLRCLLTHAFWPPVSWLLVVSAFWVPITYAIDPPTVPPRDDLLQRDPKTKVAHPREECKTVEFGKRRNMFEFEYTVTTLFTAFIFASAFIWL